MNRIELNLHMIKLSVKFLKCIEESIKNYLFYLVLNDLYSLRFKI